MKYHVDFQYRPNRDGARPQDEPILTMAGEVMTIVLENGGALPNVGDHVHFHRAGSKKNANGDYEPTTISVEGVVENKLFRFFTSEEVFVNIVVTDSSDEVGRMLIKE